MSIRCMEGSWYQNEARRYFEAGAFAEAIAAYRQAIALTEGLGHSWHELGVCLGLSGDYDGLCQLADRAAPLFPSALAFFQNVALDLMGRGACEVLAGLDQGVPVDRSYYPIAVYYAGASRVARRAYRDALPFFDRFKDLVIPRHRDYPLTSDMNFNLIYRQATLVESSQTVARLETAAVTVAEAARPTVVWQRPWIEPGSAQVFVCALNNLYFLRFARELTASFVHHRPDDLLHFHIVESDPACAALAAKLRTDYPGLKLNLSSERRPPWPGGVYYTCDRFLILPQLFRRYQVARLLTLDADSVFQHDLSNLLPHLDAYDFACFNTGRTEPASVYQATLMMFADTPVGRRFVELLRRFVLAKMAQPPILTWMLDQAALFSVICHLQEHEPAFRLGEMDRITGAGLRDAIGGLGTDAEKHDLMVQAARS